MKYKPTDEAVEKLARIVIYEGSAFSARKTLTAIRADLNGFFPVKELEWRDTGHGNLAATAYDGEYLIEPRGIGCLWWITSFRRAGTKVETIDLAKAAAQSHYAALADGMRL